MKNPAYISQRRCERGPRWHVAGTIRAGEYSDAYTTSAADAERLADTYQADGLHQVRVTPPVQYEDLSVEAKRIGDALLAARTAAADLLQQAAAITPQAHDEGLGVEETRLATLLAVDRMTIRKWLGKR